tara:strand:+ start:31481 stop:32293 length:813 start_codon:yes stop_codon:yes gene_type:complete
MSASKDTQEQFIGFLSTPLLWTTCDMFQLNQYPIISHHEIPSNQLIESNIRLGKRIELFVFHLLQRTENVRNIHKNIQIKRGKITIGELDFIFQSDKKFIHLEVVFKFYLYDSEAGFSEIEHWIGPNRNDSLSQKIEKLTVKQLPRLHLPETETILKEKGFKHESIDQFVHFQAQLFVPFGREKQNYKGVNNACIRGFYIKKSQLGELKNCQFYIPSKVNWLVNPTLNELFMEMDAFIESVSFYLNQKKSPLCWMKNEHDILSKFFIVWW